MDVATGTTHMPISCRALRVILSRFCSVFFYSLGLIFLAYLFTAETALALHEEQPIHFSGDKEIWDRRTNQVFLKGHATVVQLRELLTADEIEINFKTRLLVAKGNCVYSTESTSIWGDEMRFNIDNRQGEVIRGRVSNDRFTLRGEKIERLGEGHFRTGWGEYTTCVDCAPSG